MHTVSVRKASELPESVRSAVELVLGRPVNPDEEVTIAATPSQQVAPSASRAEQARRLEAFLDRRREKIKDVPEAEIDDAIEEALRHVRRHRT